MTPQEYLTKYKNEWFEAPNETGNLQELYEDYYHTNRSNIVWSEFKAVANNPQFRKYLESLKGN